MTDGLRLTKNVLTQSAKSGLSAGMSAEDSAIQNKT